MSVANWRHYGAGLALGLAIAGGATFWNSQPQAVAVPTAQAAYDLSNVFRSISAEAMPSIVSIETVTRPRKVDRDMSQLGDEAFPLPEMFKNDPRFRDMLQNPRRMMTPQRSGAGSGFIIDSSGVIMTNNHVVQGADEVRVRLYDGREFIATDIKTDPRTDVALIRINDAGPLKALKLGDSRKTQVGDWVLAFGTPFGLEMTVTQGIISGTSRHRGIAEREDFLQTDAAINPGNSGGPLVNLQGEVIGINTAIASASGGYDGIGFAVPTHIAGWVSDQLTKNGRVQRGYLGTSISAVDAVTAKQFSVPVREGVMVRSVLPDSPAEKAGIEPGDVIVKLNEQTVSTPPALQGVVEQLAIGSSYPLEVVRDGKPVALQVKIEELPSQAVSASQEETKPEPASTAVDKAGLQVTDLTPELARQLDLKATTGVVVSGVTEEGLAARAGVENGDIVERVGSTPVKNVEEFTAALDKLSLEDGVVLHLRNADGKRYVILRQEK